MAEHTEAARPNWDGRAGIDRMVRAGVLRQKRLLNQAEISEKLHSSSQVVEIVQVDLG